MQKKSFIALILGLVILLIVAGVAFGFIVYTEKRNTQLSLLSQYFRALAMEDNKTLEDITANGFSSNLPLTRLERGGYELFDFGIAQDPASQVQRFMLITMAESGQRQAMLAEMSFQKRGLQKEILGIQLIETGLELKP